MQSVNRIKWLYYVHLAVKARRKLRMLVQKTYIRALLLIYLSLDLLYRNDIRTNNTVNSVGTLWKNSTFKWVYWVKRSLETKSFLQSISSNRLWYHQTLLENHHNVRIPDFYKFHIVGKTLRAFLSEHLKLDLFLSSFHFLPALVFFISFSHKHFHCNHLLQWLQIHVIYDIY